MVCPSYFIVRLELIGCLHLNLIGNWLYDDFFKFYVIGYLIS